MTFGDAAVKAAELFGKVRETVGGIVSANDELTARVDRLPTRLGPYGVDPFGMDPQFLKRMLGLFAWMYRSYFRCETVGVENVPNGRCLVVANHSGQLPFDATMLTAAVFLEREPPRYLRSMVERFVPSVPYVSMFIARSGQILGTPENCRRLLEAEEAILVFPEGVRGLNKTWDQRYRLQRFGQGFMRLALETQTPIVPAVVIGAEEQAPSFANLSSLSKMFGIPSLPVTPTHPLVPGLGLWPMPTKYRIYFGEPMKFTGNADDEDDLVEQKVAQVKAAMQRMVNDGLSARQHVFW